MGRVEQDRNPAELTAVCPALYQHALQQLYGARAGYEEIFPPRVTARSLRGLSPDDANKRMKGTTEGRSTGTGHDIVKVWEARIHPAGAGASLPNSVEQLSIAVELDSKTATVEHCRTLSIAVEAF